VRLLGCGFGEPRSPRVTNASGGAGVPGVWLRDRVKEPHVSTTERETLLGKVGERTFVDAFHETCDAHGQEPALVRRPEDGGLEVRTWEDYRAQASAVAVGLRRLGVAPGGHVALMLTNRPEHVVSDTGALLAGAVPTSIYLALAPEQLAYVAGDCEAAVAIIEDAAMLERWDAVRDRLPALRTIVVIDAPDHDLGDGVMTFAQLLASGEAPSADETADLARIRRELRPDAPATLIYTSGTTGPPKGAVITHRNVLYQIEALSTLFDLRPGQRVISYLPLAHIAERVVSYYLGVGRALTVYFVADLSLLLETLQGARPQLLFGVPRVWEKMRTRLLTRLEDTPSPARRRLALTAVDVAQRQAELRLHGRPVPVRLRLAHRLLDRVVLGKIREGLGVDRIVYVASGAAPLNPELVVFFTGLGLEVLDVYGLTESTAVISLNRPGRARPGTVGRPLPGTQLLIADDGEVLTRGPHVFAGYHGRESATRDAIDDQGWLHTGDLGSVDEDGYVHITGRKKDLIITAGGKNISPSNIEDEVKHSSEIISEVCAVGDRRPFVGALIALDAEGLPDWARRHGLELSGVEEAAGNPEVLAEVERAVGEANQHLAHPEQVKRWTIVPTEWTVESGDITPTQKLKRGEVHGHHSDLIEELYHGTS
jgi:long-chain acyl-CoA synthetase